MGLGIGENYNGFELFRNQQGLRCCRTVDIELAKKLVVLDALKQYVVGQRTELDVTSWNRFLL
jgi:hypothetical protein